MKNQSMRAWLLLTGALEWFCILLFTWLMVSYSQRLVSPVGTFTWLGLATLNLVLFQGGAYWLVKGFGLGRTFSPQRMWRLIWAQYAMTGAVLLCFPVALMRNVSAVRSISEQGDLWIGLGWYLFGVGEFIHYFLFKINMRPSELRQLLRERRPVPARFLRELRRARARLVLPAQSQS